MRSEEITDQSLCVGCSLCSAVCPKKCISMVFSEDGFKYPEIDEQSCIDCKRCQKSCPVNNPVFNDDNTNLTANLAVSQDKEVYDNSSSGGIFYHLAKKVLDDGGIVIGAAWDNEFRLHHECVDSLNDLPKLLGSKYVQSDLSGIWDKVKLHLKEGRKVLFSGTPCQIGALRSLFPDGHENLLIVDVICMGVPSPLLFDRYKNEIARKLNSKIKKLQFRNKSYFGNLRSHALYIEAENKKVYARTRMDDPFFSLFLHCDTFRESCYRCSFKSQSRGSDITLADSWGVGNLSRLSIGGSVVSTVLINTKKGHDLFDSISDEIEFQSIERNLITKAQPMMVGSCKKGDKRSYILKDALRSHDVYPYLKEQTGIGVKNAIKSFLLHIKYGKK